MSVKVDNRGRNNIVEVSTAVVSNGQFRIEVIGNDNRLVIGGNTTLGHGMIEIRGNRCVVEIGESCLLNGSFRCRADETRLLVGAFTTTMSVMFTLHEAGTIAIGRDCMFSGDIRMDVSDMHSILDATTGRRINPPESIEIGEHVWVANGVHVLKGARIGSNSVIGAKALVSGEIPANSLAVGIPAKVIRTGITWDRRRLPCTG